MKHKILILSAILLPVGTLNAIVDTNTNGLSDLWERQYNDNELFLPTFDPQDDPDSDGWTNAQEAAAGTDPISTVHPHGYLQPATEHIPATWRDIDNDNIPDIIPEVVRVSWPANQSSPSLILDTGELWDPFPLYFWPLGVAEDGSMTVRIDPLIPDTMQSIKRFNAAGACIGEMTSTGGFEPTGQQGHGEMTGSGWVASNLERKANGSTPAAYRVVLWNASNEEKILPSDAAEWGYPVGVSVTPDNKVILVAGKWNQDDYTGRVYLPDESANYQSVDSLSGKKILRFAGDGTAITSENRLWRNGKLITIRELCPKYGELLDEHWNLYPLKGNKHGSFLIQADGPESQLQTKLLQQVAVIIPKTNSEGNEIDGEFVNATKLKVAKWENAFETTSENGSVKDDFIGWDKDRFYIRIPGGANLGIEAVKVATEECPEIAYNDDSTRINLSTTGSDLISESMILVFQQTIYLGSHWGRWIT